jgi:replicative DNA helicase
MLKMLSMLIVDGFGFNLKEIDDAFENLSFVNGQKADIIFFDYLQMIDYSNYEGLTAFMKEVKKWCLKKNCSFVLASQQNRAMGDEPDNKNMKGAGSIEEVSDIIILLYYPFQSRKIGAEKYKHGNNECDYSRLNEFDKEMVWKHYFEISISKNKGGATRQCIPVEYYGESYTFKDWSNVFQIINNHKELYPPCNI